MACRSRVRLGCFDFGRPLFWACCKTKSESSILARVQQRVHICLSLLPIGAGRYAWHGLMFDWQGAARGSAAPLVLVHHPDSRPRWFCLCRVRCRACVQSVLTSSGLVSLPNCLGAYRCVADNRRSDNADHNGGMLPDSLTSFKLRSYTAVASTVFWGKSGLNYAPQFCGIRIPVVLL